MASAARAVVKQEQLEEGDAEHWSDEDRNAAEPPQKKSKTELCCELCGRTPKDLSFMAHCVCLCACMWVCVDTGTFIVAAWRSALYVSWHHTQARQFLALDRLTSKESSDHWQ